MKLLGKVAVITGATSGIGKSIAELFAQEGAVIAAIGRNDKRGNQLIEEIKSTGGKGIFLQGDVSNSSRVQEIVETIINKYGKIDILVNDAGISTKGTIESLKEEEWDEIFDINVKGTYLFSKYIIPHMRKNNGGNVINVASTAGVVGAWGLHAYSATKGAVIQLSKSMAAEYGKENIRVNSLCPGGTLTPMMEYLESPEGLVEFAKMFPLKRLAQPEEIANAALFLASEDASFITGAVLLADGGFTAI